MRITSRLISESNTVSTCLLLAITCASDDNGTTDSLQTGSGGLNASPGQGGISSDVDADQGGTGGTDRDAGDIGSGRESGNEGTYGTAGGGGQICGNGEDGGCIYHKVLAGYSMLSNLSREIRTNRNTVKIRDYRNYYAKRV